MLRFFKTLSHGIQCLSFLSSIRYSADEYRLAGPWTEQTKRLQCYFPPSEQRSSEQQQQQKRRQKNKTKLKLNVAVHPSIASQTTSYNLQQCCSYKKQKAIFTLISLVAHRLFRCQSIVFVVHLSVCPSVHPPCCRFPQSECMLAPS